MYKIKITDYHLHKMRSIHQDKKANGQLIIEKLTVNRPGCSLTIEAQHLKKRHYNSLIKADERTCCISFALDFLLHFCIKTKVEMKKIAIHFNKIA